MIFGAHVIIFSKDAPADRAFFRETLGYPFADAGHDWLIFALPPAELAVHPSEQDAVHELYLMCDDLQAELATLRAKGVRTSEVEEAQWGSVTKIQLPEERPGRPLPTETSNRIVRTPILTAAIPGCPVRAGDRLRLAMTSRGSPHAPPRVPCPVWRVSRSELRAAPPAEFPQPRETLEVSGARPHREPAVTLGREPSARRRRLFGAVGGLQIPVVDVLPASAGLGDEAGTRLPGFWHPLHGANVDHRVISLQASDVGDLTD